MKNLITLLLIITLPLGAFGCGVPATDFSGVVAVHAAHGDGSGVVVAHNQESYLIVTAAHVVRDEPQVYIDKHSGKVIVVDRAADVAIIRVPDRGQDYRIRELADPRQGEPITALGWAYSGSHLAVRACYRGYVISVDWKNPPDTITANCGGFPGISGGPVFNSRGQCVGIVSGCAMIGPYTILDSTVLIIPSRVIRRLLPLSGE